jgi:Precorrin isomerase
MTGEEKEIEINISEIYDQLQPPVPVPKAEQKAEVFKELFDETNENRIKRRCIEVSGDIDYKNLEFKLHPVTAALKAFKNDAVIYTDTLLMKVAIIELILEEKEKASIDKPRGGFTSDKPAESRVLRLPKIICVAEHPKAEEFAKKYNVSKSMAGFMILKDELRGSIVVIGKDAPALLGVCRMAERGILPYLILGFPAGVNTQVTSKEYLIKTKANLPTIAMEQTKGGIESAAVCFVELMKIYEEGL